MTEDIRWKQRFQNYNKAFLQLERSVLLSETKEFSELERQGLIQAFEFTHELAWNVMKDFFLNQGNTSITGSRDATREAFQKGLIENGDGWMNMIKSNNDSTHTYNEATANEIFQKIIDSYYFLFDTFHQKMTQLF